MLCKKLFNQKSILEWFFIFKEITYFNQKFSMFYSFQAHMLEIAKNAEDQRGHASLYFHK